ncbi:homocitrate synthase family protein [Methanopyrus kandleri]
MQSPYVREAVREMDLPDEVIVYDTTLRDGEQTPGVSFTPEQKLEIAHLLDELGVQQIEAGFPVVSEGERDAVRRIAHEGLNADILCLARTLRDDVDAALDCDVDGVITFIATSELHLKHKLRMSREEVLERIADTVEYAKDHGLWVAFSAEDGTRTEFEFLERVYRTAEECGADRVHATDTVGVMIPAAMRLFVAKIREVVDLPIGVHCHDDFGMAVANSLAAVEAGAQAISTTVNGIGERAGNAALEEVIMALKELYGIDPGFNTEVLAELSRKVSEYSGIDVPPNKAVVGENAFRHESGIHVAAVLEEPRTYEPIDPKEVGMDRKIVLGKHTGRKAVIAKLEELGVEPEEEIVEEVLKRIKALGDRRVRVTDSKLESIVRDVLESRGDRDDPGSR